MKLNKHEFKKSELLKQSADKLQDYRAEIDGDYNDSLALEIYELLEKEGLKTKGGYKQ